jgi:hypothetical protein
MNTEGMTLWEELTKEHDALVERVRVLEANQHRIMQHLGLAPMTDDEVEDHHGS